MKLLTGAAVFVLLLLLKQSTPSWSAPMPQTLEELENRVANLELELTECAAKVQQSFDAAKVESASKSTAAKMMKNCALHVSCQACLRDGCGWCIGERACVPDEVWMCQGEDDHVGSIGLTNECPKMIESDDLLTSSYNKEGEGGDDSDDSEKLQEKKHNETYNKERDEYSKMAREEMLRVKVELELNVMVENEPTRNKTTADSPSKFDIQKCEEVKERASDLSQGLEDPYSTLNVTNDATTAEIRRSYRRLSISLHPDKLNKVLCGKEALLAFTNLVAAHELLSNPDRRAAFDMLGTSAEAFDTQAAYESSGRKNAKDFYKGSKHITNINEKIWRTLSSKNHERRGEESSSSHSQGRKFNIWIIEFYAPWCGACQKFTETWKKLGESIASHEPSEDDDWFGVDIEVGAINCETNHKICQEEFNIRKYPTIRLVSPGWQTQHEFENGGDAADIRESAFEIAAEWKWLFDRADLRELSGREDFDKYVMSSSNFHIVIFTDGERCGPCRSAKTNALRLSAGLQVESSSIKVSMLDCARNAEVRKFCTEEVGLPLAPHAPLAYGYSWGDKTKTMYKGEVLYNPNEVPPHAALRIIESIVRLNGGGKNERRDCAEEGNNRGVGERWGGNEARWDERGEEQRDSEGGRPRQREGRRKQDGLERKLNWNGPSSRVKLTGVEGGARTNLLT